jgi:isoquinoline 1-oxidoreductase alpha subunit
MAKLRVNGTTVEVPPTPGDATLLWILRDELELTGTKFGCGTGLCGACTVHMDGKPVRSCLVTLENAAGHEIKTIEGLSSDSSHPLQRAWIAEQVPQCGYCQSGQIMSAAALLESNPEPSDDEINEAMQGNLCRCGTYNRIRQAIKLAAGTQG